MGNEFYGIIDPRGAGAENNIPSLLNQHRDRLNIVKAKENPLEILKQLVDVEDYALENIVKAHLEILEYNIKHSPAYSGGKIELKLYKVVNNEKSRLYYNEMSAFGEDMFQPYFSEQTMVLALEETVGPIEIGSQLLSYDYAFLRGVTTEDISNESPELVSFLAKIDGFETSYRDQKEIDCIFNEIKK